MFSTPMKIEILRDPKAIAANYELLLNEDHELLGTYPWLEWCRRTSGNDRLFAYRHRRTGRFVIAAWLWSPGESTVPVATEIEGFNTDPSWFWPEGLLCPAVMKERLKPIDEQYAAMKRRRQDRHELEQRSKAEDLKHRDSVVRYLKRRGLDEAARDLDTGAAPFVGPARAPEAVAMWTEALMDMAKGT